jgi:glycosyltransferase involved in cell wall biosynthesis
MPKIYQTASIFFWPGVNEAIGMTYLEAQAAGLAIVAQNRPGLRDVLPPGSHPAPEEGPQALARVLDRLLRDPSALAAAQQAARQNVNGSHLLDTAARTLHDGLRRIGVTP